MQSKLNMDSAIDKLMEGFESARLLGGMDEADLRQLAQTEADALNAEAAELESGILGLPAKIALLVSAEIAELRQKADSLMAQNFSEIVRQGNLKIALGWAMSMVAELGLQDDPKIEIPESPSKFVWHVQSDRVFNPVSKSEILGFTAGKSDEGTRCAIAGWSLPAGHPLRKDAWVVGFMVESTLFVKGLVSSNVGKEITRISHLLAKCDKVWDYDARTGINGSPFSQNQTGKSGKFFTPDEISKLELLDVRQK